MSVTKDTKQTLWGYIGAFLLVVIVICTAIILAGS